MVNVTDIYNIKEHFIKVLAPKYFEMEDVNQFNVGLFGYTTEMAAFSLEETLNATNTLYKEQFITKATFEDTIYTQAGLLGIDGFNAIPAKMGFGIFIKISDIVNSRNFDNGIYKFVIERGTIFYIEEIPYSLDYDVVVTAFEKYNGYVFNGEYDMSSNNNISYIKTSQIRTVETTVEGEQYLTMMLSLRQYTRSSKEFDLIVNSNFNFPTVELEYVDQFGGIDIEYQVSEGQPWVAMKPIFNGSPPLKTPFAYYRHKEKGNIEVSFSTRDLYFKPAYNSKLRVTIYQTVGTKGTFDEYNGINVGISLPNTSDYSSSIILRGFPNGSSNSAKDMKDIETLRGEIVERYSSSGAFNTDSDLENYFNNRLGYTDGSFVKFIKRRDDLVERLFSCFGLYKNKEGDYFHTNTLPIHMYEGDFDTVLDGGNRYILQPGKKLGCLPNGAVRPMDDTDHCKFTYSNPFMISMQKNPNTVAFYNNSVFEKLNMEYEFSSKDTEYQFAINSVDIERNSVNGDKSYSVTVVMKPFFELEPTITNGSIDLDADVKIVLAFKDGSNYSKAIVMQLDNYSALNNTISFVAEIESTDEVSINERVLLDNLYDVGSGTFGPQAVPMIDTQISICVMIKDSVTEVTNPFYRIAELEDYRLTASFTNESERFNLITPLKHMRSTVKFNPDIEHGYSILINLVPLVSHELSHARDKLEELMAEVKKGYNVLNDIMDLKTQNYSLDLKFYNTYGVGKNYSIGDDVIIDRVNISIKVAIGINDGYMQDDVVREVRERIKKHVEDMSKDSKDIDSKGYNSFYISSVIQELKNTIPSLKFIIFKSMNEYTSDVQIIEMKTDSYEDLPKSEQRNYVPEYLTIDTDQIMVEVKE